MPAFIVAALRWIAGNFLARVLAGAGLALAGSYSFGQFIDYFINLGMAQLSHIPMTGLIGLAGFDKAISIMLSSVFVRLSIYSATKSISIVKK